MKKKLIVTTIALGLFISAIPLNVSAEEIDIDGLQISTSSDKTEYQENENPVITVSISNSNDWVSMFTSCSLLINILFR